MLYKTLDTGAN